MGPTVLTATSTTKNDRDRKSSLDCKSHYVEAYHGRKTLCVSKVNTVPTWFIIVLVPYTSSVGIIRYSRLKLDRYIMPYGLKSFKATIRKIAKY